MAGRIKARIDSHSKVLYAQNADLRAETFEHTLATSADSERAIMRILLRIQLLQNHLIVGSRRDRGAVPDEGSE